MNRKLLITSGGTSEAIDQVRAITNHASGHLGKLIAEKALDAGARGYSGYDEAGCKTSAS